MSEIIEGGCLCGAVRYKARGGARGTAACHCVDCQRASGAPFAANFFMKREDVEITGELRGYTVKADSGADITRRFCPTCGSVVTIEPAVVPHMRALTAGSLDDSSWFRPAQQYWLEHKQAWVELGGDIPGCARNPGA